MTISLDALISLIGVGCYGLLIVLTLVRRRVTERATLTLSFYLALGLIWSVGSAVIALGLAPAPGPRLFFDWLATIGRNAMPLVFGAVTLSFLGHKKALYWYWSGGALIFALWVVLSFNFYGLSNRLGAAWPAAADTHTQLTYLAIVVWGIATIIAVCVLYLAFKKYPQAQYRNRFLYWLGGILILTLAGIVILLQIPHLQWLGTLINLVGAGFITYVVLNFHPPELKLVASRAIQVFITTLILSVVMFGLLNTAYLFNHWQIYSANVLFWLIIMAIGSAFILPYLVRLIGKLLDRLLIGRTDESAILKAYSQDVNSDWDFNKLSRQALDFILKDMAVERGAIFVDEGDGSGHVTLKLVAEMGMPQPDLGYFSGGDPWVTHLRQKQTPITQYDLDVLPQYKELDETSKKWLIGLNADIFLPLILRRKQLVGVLALGPKPGHKPYLPQDLSQLQMLTSQIALDMDKARLFGQLGAVNQRLGELNSEFKTFDQGKTDFLSIASHELRTPLTHIHGYASMLIEASEDEKKDPAYLEYILSGIARGSTRLKDIVDLVFDVSKADLGELEIIKTPVDLAEVVDEATENQKSALQERGHKLIIAGMSRLPMVEGGTRRLAQAIEHLLNNAIKYTPDGGTITISGRTINDDPDHPKVEIIVTDTGIGIDPKDHQRIFQKFYRVGNVNHHSTSSVKFKGAGPGLGLSLVAGIAKAHGGEVWVESPEYNEETCPGSQFHLILPVKSPQTEMETPEPDEATSMAKTRHWRSDDKQLVLDRIAAEEKKKKTE